VAERRDVTAEEMQTIARLAARSRDLGQLEQDLEELALRRAEGAHSHADFAGATAALMPRSVREVLELHRQGLITAAGVRSFLGLEPRAPWWRRLWASATA